MSVALEPTTIGEATPATRADLREYRDRRSGISLGMLSASHAPEGAIALPEPGERVTLGAGEMPQGHWIGIVEPVSGPEVTVRLLSDGEARCYASHVDSLHATRIVTGRAEGETVEALQALAAVCRMSDIARREGQERLDALVAAAHEYAEDANLCERFDEFMQSQGLPAREADYTVRVEVTGVMSLAVSAHSEEQAQGAVTLDMLRDHLPDLEYIQYTVENATREP